MNDVSAPYMNDVLAPYMNDVLVPYMNDAPFEPDFRSASSKTASPPLLTP